MKWYVNQHNNLLPNYLCVTLLAVSRFSVLVICKNNNNKQTKQTQKQNTSKQTKHKTTQKTNKQNENKTKNKKKKEKT